MPFETTRRRFIALLSSLVALPQMKGRAFAPARTAESPALKAPAKDVLIWFEDAAPEWAAALPVGNGRLGAMVFGGVQQERIALNEDTLWSGSPRDWNNPDARNHLPVVRKLLLDDKDYHAADTECRYMQGSFNQAYQPVGDLLINFAHVGKASGYRRELNLDTAIVTVTYEADGATYTREIFASAPAHVIVTRLASNKPGGLNCKVRLTSQLKSQSEAAGSEIHLTGKAPEESAPNYLVAPGHGPTCLSLPVRARPVTP